jgi:hypothetical protein
MVKDLSVWCNYLGVFFHGLKYRVLELRLKVFMLGLKVFVVTFKVVVQGLKIYRFWCLVLRSRVYGIRFVWV